MNNEEQVPNEKTTIRGQQFELTKKFVVLFLSKHHMEFSSIIEKCNKQGFQLIVLGFELSVEQEKSLKKLLESA